MTFKYSVTLTDPSDLGGSSDPLLVADLNRALSDWSQYIAGIGTLVVNLVIGGSNSFADGGASTQVADGTLPGGATLVEPSSLYELITGNHVVNYSSDITITVDPSSITHWFLNPNPGNGAAVPKTEIDAVSVFRHELEHGFGMTGYYSQNGTLAYGGAYLSLYDQFVRIEPNGSAYFVGPTAEAVYGGPVPLTTDSTTENYYHFANSVNDRLGQDLMNGQFFYYGATYKISNVDIAILKDIGVPVTGGVGGPLPSVVAHIATADFNDDTVSDILWQHDNGTPAIWEMIGFSAVGSVALADPGTSWHEKASGDFNGDGTADILWQNDNGTPAIWEMNGTNVIASAALTDPGTSWHVIATGDFNGDGKADILWQNDNGTPAIWEMNGTSVVASAALLDPGASWHIKATGDFNGDGKSDILWQNDNGTPAIWEMNGTSVIASAALPDPGTSWHIEGTGDFNGDGHADILWQNDNGTPAIWEMNGTNVVASAVLLDPGASWHVRGTGDYNGDGKSDILWQNDNGQVAIWEMNGTSVIASAALANPGTPWQVVGTDGMFFISGASGNATLAASPAMNDVFIFTSFAAGAHAISGFDPARDIVELALGSFANFTAVQAHSTPSGGGTLIALNAQSSLLIQGVVPGALSANDFRFV